MLLPQLALVPLAPYVVAVAIAAWYGGSAAALVAMLASLLPIHLAALAPHPAPPAAAQEFTLYVVFTLVSLLLILLTASRDHALRAAAHEQARAEALADATRGLGAASLDLPAVLESIAHSAASHVGDLAVLWLLSRDGAWLEGEAIDHPQAATRAALAAQERVNRQAARQGVNGAALQSGRALRLTAAEVAARKWADPELWPAEPEMASAVMMAAPLQVEGRGIGTLSVSRASADRPYTADDERFLQELADRAALAIERARLFERVRTNEVRLATLVEQLPVGIGLTDERGRWVLTNAEMRQYVGDILPSQDPGQRPRWQCWDDRGTPLPPDQWPGHRALRGESLESVECLVTRERDDVWTQVSGAPFTDSAGDVVGTVCVIQNIDAHKRAEDERAAFLDALAHDIKNPLSAAKGQTQLALRRIQREPGDATRLVRNLDAIEVALEQAASLLGEVLDVAHLRAGRSLELQLAPVDLVAMASACLHDLQARRPQHRLRLETPAPTLVGNWDAARLDRVLRNLLDNAVKFSPDGGEVRLILSEEFREDGASWVTVQVQDHGVGIPPDDLERIFERFQRGRNVGGIQGTGIGLAGVRQIVAQHQGTVTVESVEGQGATFTVRLPRDPQLTTADTTPV